MNRRGFLSGITGPFIVRFASIMPVKAIEPPPLMCPPPFMWQDWEFGVGHLESHPSTAAAALMEAPLPATAFMWHDWGFDVIQTRPITLKNIINHLAANSEN